MRNNKEMRRVSCGRRLCTPVMDRWFPISWSAIAAG